MLFYSIKTQIPGLRIICRKPQDFLMYAMVQLFMVIPLLLMFNLLVLLVEIIIVLPFRLLIKLFRK